MKRLLSRLKTEFPFLHTRPATENDFHEYCADHDIEIVYTSDVSSGMYVLFSGKHYVFLNSRLKGWKLRHVMFHELAHYLFHAPSQSNMAVEFFSVHAKVKNHREAEAAAAWLLVTKADLSAVDGEPDFLPADRELYKLRIELLKRYRV